MYTQLHAKERETIAVLRALRVSIPRIAQALGRDPTTVRRELKRPRPRYLGYSALRAEDDAVAQRHRPRRAKKLDDPRLWYVPPACQLPRHGLCQ